MNIIDLTQPLYTGMPVYPGDPPVSIEQIQTLEKNGWNLQRIHINSHDGTHVNVPMHMVAHGNTLDNYPIDAFCGPAKIYNGVIEKDKGVLFRDQNIDTSIAEEIKNIKPRFVGLSNMYEFPIDLERELLQAGIIIFERLECLDQLPAEFMFYGIPLKIKDGDGSPIRAFAVIE